MKDRIKKIRRHFDLTQREFGERIGVKANTIATYEGGRNDPIDSVVTLICREFRVNEKWLRTGEGEMLAPSVTDELEALAKRYPNLIHESLVFIEKLTALSSADQGVIMGFLREVVSGFGDVTPETPAMPGATADGADPDAYVFPRKESDPSAIDVKAEVASYEEELLLQKKAEGESSASDGQNASAG